LGWSMKLRRAAPAKTREGQRSNIIQVDREFV
jgi:hypothetical protein